MAQGWEALGNALAGNDTGNMLAYAKGQSLGANTEAALATARASNAKETAKQGMKAKLVATGMPEAEADAVSTSFAAGAGLGDYSTMQGKRQEQGFRQNAVTSALGNDIAGANANLVGVANAPVESLYTVGEGHYANKFKTQDAPTTSDLGEALIGKDKAATALDIAKTQHPENFSAVAKPQLVDMGGGRKGVLRTNADGSYSLVPTIEAPTFNTNVKDTSGAKKFGATEGANASGLPGRLNDINTMTGNIDKLLASPGFNSIYGHVQGTGAGQAVTKFLSQDAANASAMRDQLNAEGFGVSVQKMRGLGALSDAEGKKVQAALTRLSDSRISPEEAKVAAADLKAAMQRLSQVAIQEAGGQEKLNALLGGGGQGAPTGGGATLAPNGKDYSSMF